MKREEIIKSLISEGFSEKTLNGMTTKSLSIIAEKITVSSEKLKSDPEIQAMAKDPNVSIEVTEETEKCGCGCEIGKCPCGPECTKCDCGKKKEHTEEIEEWVLDLAESNYSTFTSKGEILTMVNEMMMVNESEEIEEDSIPEFMTYDSIKSSTETKPAPPKIAPGTKPGKPKIGPGIKPNPKPKALSEKK